MADHELTQAVRVLARLSRYVERACQDSELSLPQYRLLLWIAHRSQRAGELATKAAVSRPTLTSLIDGLEKQGLVERTRVSGDRRGINLELTQKGKEALDKTESVLLELVGPVMTEAGSGVVDGLIAVGETLDQHFDSMLARRAASSEKAGNQA
jgi:DNA-binding MarR family transcriptional regulator